MSIKSHLHSTTTIPLLVGSHGSSVSCRKRIGFLRNWRRRLRAYLLVVGIIVIILFTLYHKASIKTANGGNGRTMQTNIESLDSYRHSKFKGRLANTSNELYKKPKGIRTVTAKYIGPQPWWANGKFNLSLEELNANNYSPEAGMGKNGRPVYIIGESNDKVERSFSINRFNLLASDKISVDRKLPDPRKLKCKSKSFELNKLPNTSVIIVFHNEAWSTLVRTVHSILNTSPKLLLRQIILVDDASERKFLGKELSNYMTNLSESRGTEIIVLRSAERVGLIKARLIGVKKAEGETLTFIDAHCEATTGWLEPLMEVIAKDKSTAAVPIIDTISEHTFAYKRTFDLYMGAFNWGLNFRWYPISADIAERTNNVSTIARASNKTDMKHSQTLIAPFMTPAMAGGLFSIDKQYFFDIGTYDSGMDIWGAENIELSLRIWQCGGSILAVPCSHVAHLFRKSSPYKGRQKHNVDEIFNFNRVRLIEVWLDEWKHFVYSMNPILLESKKNIVATNNLEGLEQRIELRRKMKCKSFAWFLDNVWQSNFFPTSKRLFGKIKHLGTSKCIERLPSKVLGLRLQNCLSKMDQIQSFVVDNSTNLIMSNDNNCLDIGSSPKAGQEGFFTACIDHKRQQWKLTKSKHLLNIASNLCLEFVEKSGKIQLENCNSTNQQWQFMTDEWKI